MTNNLRIIAEILNIGGIKPATPEYTALVTILHGIDIEILLKTYSDLIQYRKAENVEN